MYRHFNTPLITACYTSHVTSNAEEILQLGANINAQGSAENTALCIAAICGNSTLCKLLIDAGADVTICTYDGDISHDTIVFSGLPFHCIESLVKVTLI